MPSNFLHLSMQIFSNMIYHFPDPAAPPRPPLPTEGLNNVPSRPPPPPMLDTTDDESEDLFQNAPTASQGPIMVRLLLFKYVFIVHFIIILFFRWRLMTSIKK